MLQKEHTWKLGTLTEFRSRFQQTQQTPQDTDRYGIWQVWQSGYPSLPRHKPNQNRNHTRSGSLRCWTCLGLFLLIVCSVLHSTGSVCSVRLSVRPVRGLRAALGGQLPHRPTSPRLSLAYLPRDSSSLYRTPCDGSIPSFSTPLSVRGESSLNHRPSASARIRQSSPLGQWLDPLVSQ